MHNAIWSRAHHIMNRPQPIISKHTTLQQYQWHVMIDLSENLSPLLLPVLGTSVWITWYPFTSTHSSYKAPKHSRHFHPFLSGPHSWIDFIPRSSYNIDKSCKAHPHLFIYRDPIKLPGGEGILSSRQNRTDNILLVRRCYSCYLPKWLFQARVSWASSIKICAE